MLQFTIYDENRKLNLIPIQISMNSNFKKVPEFYNFETIKYGKCGGQWFDS